MAKKSSNPADAFRKAQRAKEVKKNKDVRKKVREAQNVKKDTRSLENELHALKGKKDDASKARVAELEKEIGFVNKAKEAYVKAHPDERDKVFGRPRRPNQGGGDDGEEDGEEKEGKRNQRLYDEQGRLRDPTRSVYYDPVYNPWGVPPPGMPYRERDHIPEPSDSESDSDEDDSDDDIVMPEGPPPGSDSENDSDDSDDIPLPDGPPPTKGPPANAPTGPRGAPPLPPMPFPAQGGAFPPPMPSQPFYNGGLPPFPPSVPGMHMPVQGMQGMRNGPMPPYARPPPQQDMGWGAHYAEGSAGPSTGFAQARPFRPPHRGRGGHRGGGPRNAPAVQDPLSDEPTQTYQGHRIARATANLPVRPGAPDAPDGTPKPAAPPTAGAGEISAAPQLRDLRKEATAFVPRNIKKKIAAGAGSGVGRINSAPNAGVVDDEGDERVVRREESGLMSHLKGVLGPMPGAQAAPGGAGIGASGSKGAGAGDDDYQRFLDGLGDLA